MREQTLQFIPVSVMSCTMYCYQLCTTIQSFLCTRKTTTHTTLHTSFPHELHCTATNYQLLFNIHSFFCPRKSTTHTTIRTTFRHELYYAVEQINFFYAQLRKRKSTTQHFILPVSVTGCTMHCYQQTLLLYAHLCIAHLCTREEEKHKTTLPTSFCHKLHHALLSSTEE